MTNVKNTLNFKAGDEVLASDECTITRKDRPTYQLVKCPSDGFPKQGDIVTYTGTLKVIGGDFKEDGQFFEDILPDTLQYIDGTLKIDGAGSDCTLDHVDVDFAPDSEHVIEYQCKVL